RAAAGVAANHGRLLADVFVAADDRASGAALNAAGRDERFVLERVENRHIGRRIGLTRAGELFDVIGLELPSAAVGKAAKPPLLAHLVDLIGRDAELARNFIQAQILLTGHRPVAPNERVPVPTKQS